jgi:hypothetical protein
MSRATASRAICCLSGEIVVSEGKLYLASTDVTAADLSANPDVAQFEAVASTAQPYNLGTQYTNIETNTWEPAIEKILEGAPVVSTLDGANSQINGYLGG